MAITKELLREQEESFSVAFARADLERVRSFYHPKVVYVSPTVRLFDWPVRIEGIDRTLEFISLTIKGLTAVRYEAVESVLSADGATAFVRIHFDWTSLGDRLRSNYVVIYRYEGHLIRRQELYYDPSGELEKL